MINLFLVAVDLALQVVAVPLSALILFGVSKLLSWETSPLRLR